VTRGAELGETGMMDRVGVRVRRRSGVTTQDPPDRFRADGHVEVGDPELLERVDDRPHDRRRGADRAGLARKVARLQPVICIKG